jgi:RNA polymerase sigma factor (sigma-70 family)
VAEVDQQTDAIRRLMFGIAYRMLGSVADAEDVVQDSFVRIEEARRDGVEIESERAYAATVATRLSIDLLRSARRRRESYVGTWLPEPLVEDADPALRIEEDDTLTIAFITVVERLKPVDRAVYVLREAYAFGYDEIAAIVGKTEAACRQIYSRAGRAVRAERPVTQSSRGAARLAERLVAAMRAGDVDAVATLLSADVVFSADGGGKAPAIAAPLHGRTQVARFLLGLARQASRVGGRMEPARANAEEALRLVGPDGALIGVMVLHDSAGEIAALFNQINPDKLRHLGPVGDAQALLRQAQQPGR